MFASMHLCMSACVCVCVYDACMHVSVYVCILDTFAIMSVKNDFTPNMLYQASKPFNTTESVLV